MRPLGLNEALAFTPAGDGPRVSVYLGGNLGNSGRLREAFIRHVSGRAQALILNSYGPELATRCWGELAMGLRDLAYTPPVYGGGLAFFWSPVAARAFKVPIEVPDQSITSSTFHIKPLVEARELKRDFLLIADHGTQIGVYRVLPTKLCQLQVFKAETRDDETWLKPAVAVAIADVVRWGMTLAPVPILIAADGAEATWIEEVLSWLDVPKVTLSTRGLVELGSGSLFEAARRTMDPLFAHLRREAASRLSSPATFEACAKGVTSVGRALAHGRVKNLFVADDQCIWGEFDSKSGECIRHPGQVDAYDGDILNAFIQEARRRNVPVHVLPSAMLPGGEVAVAICDGFPIKGRGNPTPLQVALHARSA